MILKQTVLLLTAIFLISNKWIIYQFSLDGCENRGKDVFVQFSTLTDTGRKTMLNKKLI